MTAARLLPRLLARPLVVGAVLGVLVGCAGADPAPGPAAPSAGTPPPAAPAPASTPPAAPPSGTAAGEPGCVDHERTVSMVRGIADAVAQGPVLPAGVALFLLGPRTRAAAVSDSADPELVAARAELVAAIDELDAQGRAALPPGGDAARNPVQLDPTRILAAADELERLCSGS